MFEASLPFFHRFLLYLRFSPAALPRLWGKGMVGCIRVSWCVLHTRLLGASGVLALVTRNQLFTITGWDADIGCCESNY